MLLMYVHELIESKSTYGTQWKRSAASKDKGYARVERFRFATNWMALMQGSHWLIVPCTTVVYVLQITSAGEKSIFYSK